jgi:hypothetical protein
MSFFFLLYPLCELGCLRFQISLTSLKFSTKGVRLSMWVQLALLTPPAAAMGLARIFPDTLFPPTPKCQSDSPELLQHCQRMSQRFVIFSVLATAFVWFHLETSDLRKAFIR